MNCRTTNAVTLSAALALGAVGAIAPTAHGHGNNPSVLNTGGHNWPHDPPGGGPWTHHSVIDPVTPASANPGGGLGGPDSMHSVIPFVDLAEAASSIGAGTVLVPSPAGLELGLDLGLDLGAPTSSLSQIQLTNSLDVVAGSGFVDIPVTRMVPSPGTLALLGVAAMVLRRRRRG